MTTGYLAAALLFIVACSVGAFVVTTRPRFITLLGRVGTMPPPMIGAISILFGLFIGFSSAEIGQRATNLRLSTQREVSAARSILNFTTGIGPRANTVREAVIEYLQVVTTTETNWLRDKATGEAPGNQPIYSLNLITTGFVQQPGVSDVLKGVLMSRVEDLTNARTERLTLSRASGSIPQWVGLTALAIVTILVGAVSAGPVGGRVIFLAGYSATALVALLYLGFTDSLLGASSKQQQSAPFEALLVQTPAVGASGEDTMARMREGGTIVLGARTDAFPFAYANGSGEVVGYSVDLCKAIVEDIRTSAGLGPIRIQTLALSPANRVAMVVNGTADIECDLSTDNSGRESQVAFIPGVFYGKTQVLTNNTSGIGAVKNLHGKRLIAVFGSTNIQAAADLNASQHLGLSVVPAKDTPDALRMLDAGQGGAVISSDILIKGLLAKEPHPDTRTVFDAGLGVRNYGLMVRKDNAAFKASIVQALKHVMSSGLFEKDYARWFETPISPDNINLMLPMSPSLQQTVHAAQSEVIK